MPKAIGRNARIWINQANVSGDLNDMTIGHEGDTPENTAYGSTNHTFETDGLRTWSVSWSGLFNDTNTAGGLGVEAMVSLSGEVAGSGLAGAWWRGHSTCMIGYEGDVVIQSLNVSTPLADMATSDGTLSGCGWLARTRSLSGSIISSSTAASTYSTCSFDNSVSTTKVIYGILRVPQASATTAGSLQAVIQHSGDDSSWATLIAFTTFDVTNGSTFEAKSVSGASRYLRAGYAIGGATGSDSQVALFISGGPVI